MGVTADSAAWVGLQKGPEGTVPDAAAFRRVFVRVRGKISQPAAYGHFGAYDRRLRVTEVLAVSAAYSAGCGDAS